MFTDENKKEELEDNKKEMDSIAKILATLLGIVVITIISFLALIVIIAFKAYNL